MSEEIKGIKFFRLESEVEGDETLNGSLGASDVDGNFYYLREMLIASAWTAEYNVELENGEIETTAEMVLERVNGKSLHIDMTPFLPNFEEYEIQTEYDPTLGVIRLSLLKDDEVVTVNTINGIITEDNFKHAFDDATDFAVIKRVLSDDTIKGLGTKDQLLGVSPLYINGQMKPCKSYIDITEADASLPEGETGDMYVVKDFSDEYGKLYPYAAVKKIQLDLDADAQRKYVQYSADTSNIGWRIPCADDWDDMLNAVELEYAKSIGCVEYDASGNVHSTLDKYPTYTHTSYSYLNYALGYVAGRLLRSKSYWSGSTENKGWQTGEEYIGTDSYGFKAEPVGYAMIDEILLMHGKEGSMWIAGDGGALFDPKNKLHQYDYIQFYGLGNAKAKTFLSSGATDGGPANLVRTDLTSTDSYRSIRLVKEYDGGNYHSREDILNHGYDTILLPSLTAESGYKVWTVENFDIDYKLNDGTYKYGSKPTINDMLDDADEFKRYFLAYKGPNTWEYRELHNGDSIVVEEPIFSGDNAFDEYRLINGQLINVTTDEFKIYNKIADVEQKVEMVQSDTIKSFVWAWGAIDDITKLAKTNREDIDKLSDDLIDFGNTLNELSDKTQDAVDGLTDDLNDLYAMLGIQGSSANTRFAAFSSMIETLNAEVEELKIKEAQDVEMLQNQINEVSANTEAISAFVEELNSKFIDLNDFVMEHKDEIEAIATLSGDLYQLSGEVDTRYNELVTLIDSKISQLQQELIDLIKNRFSKLDERVKVLESDVDNLKDRVCVLEEKVNLQSVTMNSNIPVFQKAIKELQEIDAENRLETLETKVEECCSAAGGEAGGDDAVSLEYIQNMIKNEVSSSILTSVTINDIVQATVGDGIKVNDCGVSLTMDFNTDEMSFEPITSETIGLDNMIPFNVGGIPCGTTLRELSGINVSILLQNLLFPTIYPTIYAKPSIYLTDAEPLFSAPISGDTEKDGCYVHKNYIVVEVGTKFQGGNLPVKDMFDEDSDAGYYENSKAYIKADCSKMTEDQYITNGLSGVTYMLKQTPYDQTTDGSNIVYPSNLKTTSWKNGGSFGHFESVGEVEVYAEGHFKPTTEPLLDSNGNETDNVYVTDEEGKETLTTLEELKKESEGERYNFYFPKSNTLKVYVSEPIFMVNGIVLEQILQDMYSSSNNPLYYSGWRKGYEEALLQSDDDDEEASSIIVPKNGVGSVIGMQKWGRMHADFNVVTDFVSLDFGILSPIELNNISMRAYDTNEADNNQVTNFVSKDALLDETFSYYVSHQDEWMARNIPNGFVKYDKPVYVAFQHWGDCSDVSIGVFYFYVWVGGAQVPTTFSIETKDPSRDNEEFLDKQ